MGCVTIDGAAALRSVSGEIPVLTLNRRCLLTSVAASATIAACAPSGNATPAEIEARSEAPGFYRFPFGEFQITMLCDGVFFLPTDSIATNVDAHERKAYFCSLRGLTADLSQFSDS